jgi:hypothetical protein
MKRRIRFLPAIFVMAAAGCAGPEAGPEAMVWGTIMVLVGLGVAAALLLGLSD